MLKKTKTSVSKTRPLTKARGKLLKEAPHDKAFWVNNGRVVRTLAELQAALRVMSDEQYHFHTKRSGNDFSRWVKDVLFQTRLSGQLLKAKNQHEAAAAVAAFV